MTGKEAAEWIESCVWQGSRTGLERSRELLSLLGDPQKKLRFVHVAGSNGKGSTCSMLESVMRKAGYTTGLFISPYIEEFAERIQVCGKNIPDEALGRLADKVKQAADTMAEPPRMFELVTAVGMLYFAERRCDIVILEVGLGGEFDPTNVIDAPEASVITNLGLEHTEYLGNTLTEIAHAKAGIIKTGSSCISYDSPDEALRVIREVCARKDVPLRVSRYRRLVPVSSDLRGQSFLWDGKEYRIRLAGPHQLHNAAVVLETLDILREKGWMFTEKDVKEGLADAAWPARMEILCEDPLFILDGGHNPQCASAMADCIKKMVPCARAVFLTGVLAEKDYSEIFSILSPYAEQFVCVAPMSPRALPGEKLAEYLTDRGLKAVYAGSIKEGIEKAILMAGNRFPVIAFGSLYLAGEVRTIFREMTHFR